MVVQAKLITADDLWDMTREDQRLELVKGIPVEVSPTGEVHMILAAWLTYLLTAHVEAHGLGVVTVSEGGFRLAADPDTVRAPDVGFIAQARLTQPTGERYFPGAPDLAVEIVSPGDSASDMHDKVVDYLHAGTRLVWVVYPRSKTVAVYTSGAEGQIVDPDGTLDGGDVLPGLSLPVRDIFVKLRE
jgi:Uma2 family endonuclease